MHEYKKVLKDSTYAIKFFFYYIKVYYRCVVVFYKFGDFENVLRDY